MGRTEAEDGVIGALDAFYRGNPPGDLCPEASFLLSHKPPLTTPHTASNIESRVQWLESLDQSIVVAGYCSLHGTGVFLQSRLA